VLRLDDDDDPLHVEVLDERVGHLPPPVPADKAIEEKIDEAASVGAHPLAEEHPPEEIIEVPDDRPVTPGEKS
jgi:cell division protease FtsH